MAQQYLIDGYNMLHAIPKYLEILDWDAQQARKALESLVELYCRSGDIRATVVYDSMTLPDAFDDYMDGTQPEIVYTGSSKSADDFLIMELEKSRSPSTCVVTRDNKILRAAGSTGCSAMDPQELYDLMLKKSKGRPGNRPGKYRDQPLDQSEIEMWKELFESGDAEK